MTYNITLTANHQSLTAEYLPLAAESVQYLTAKVVCETEDWTGREIKAMFGQGCTVYEVPVTGGEITAKQQLNLTAGDWRVWLVGNSARDGDVIPRITTNVAHIIVAPTGGTEGSPFPTIPPTVEEQLRADMGNLADLTTEDKSSFVAAINEVRRTGGGGVQPDWNQNDETAADYVKNRPFYTGDPVETVLVEESTVTFAENHGLYMAQFPSTFAATVGETYKVYWDGAAYECTCVLIENLPAIGNPSIMGPGSDTGEPFLMGVDNGRRIIIMTADTSASHTFSISGVVSEVVKIDPKYIRDMYYTGDPVETVLVEESTVPFSFSEDEGIYTGRLESTFSATVGETYTVSWDGTAYECTCVDFFGETTIGNLSIAGAGSDTGEPFLMVVNNGWGIFIGTADTSASHTISISGLVSEVVKIDPKYLPDTIATKSEVEAAQTTASNAQTTANNAQTTANNAQTTANNAQTTASNAQTTASNAKSEALDLAARMFGHTSVVDSAFYHDKTLSITSLPACIESIGANAFNGCTNLALTSLPSGITSIGVNAFQGCKKLALTSLPSGLTSISDYAFYECTNLALTSLPSGLTSIGDYAFIGCTGLALTPLPSGLTSIGDHAFANCPNLALTSLPSGLTSIGGYAFSNCKNLALTSLPSGLTSISDYAFIDCINLALTSLPSGLTSIGGYAFDRCTNLALTSLPSGLTSIGDCAFAGCPNLALTSLPSGLTSISARAFAGCPNLALTSLPSGLTSIGDHAFANCPNLALTSLPSGLTSIDDYAFYECTNLALTSLPSGLTSIGARAFYGCPNLALTSLPSGLTSIGSAAFQGCTGLTSITFTGKPTRIANNVFEGCTNLTTINVPWAEGEVANSPWGATNATINYNYTEA